MENIAPANGRRTRRFAMAALAVLGMVAALAPTAFADPPANDAFLSAQQLSADNAVAAGDTREATREAPSEPNHDNAGGSASVWYRFSPVENGAIEVNVCSADFETALAVYRGDTLGALTPVKSNACLVTTPVTGGQPYRIAVDGVGPAKGRFTLRFKSWIAPANDAFASAEPLAGSSVSVDGDNRGASRQAGETDHYPGRDASVWYTWTPSAMGGVHIDVCTPGGAEDLRVAIFRSSVPGGSSLETRACEAWFSIASADVGFTYRIAVDGTRSAFNLRLDFFAKPANDDFDSAFGNQLAANGDIVAVDTRGASRQTPPEPNHSSQAGDASVWYAWVPTADGVVRVDTCTEEFDTYAAIYSGPNQASLTPVARPSNCVLEIAVVQNTVYWIAVETRASDEVRGTFELQLEFFPRPLNDDFALAQNVAAAETVVTGDTRGATREPAEPTSHSGQSAGSGTVWYRWQAPMTGRARVDACDSFNAQTGAFRVAAYVGGSVGTAVKQAGGLCVASFRVVAGNFYHVVVEGARNGVGSFAARFDVRVTPPNDDFANPQLLTSEADVFSGDTTTATYEQNELEAPDPLPDGSSVWFRWVAPFSGALTLSTCSVETAYDTTLRVFRGSAINDLTHLGFNDDATDCGTQSKLRVDVEVGSEYRIVVDGNQGSVPASARRGAYQLDLTLVDDVAPETEITSDEPQATLTDDQLEIEFESDDANATFECAVDPPMTFSPCSSPATIQGLPEGGSQILVRAIDQASNVDMSPATMSVYVDTVAPTTEFVAAPPSHSNDTTPTFGYTSDPGAEFECRVVPAAFSPCNEPIPHDYADAGFTTAPLADGTYTFEVRARDEAGNLGPIAEREFTVDTTPPTATIDSGPTDPADTTPSFRFSSSEPNSTFSCRIDSGPVFPCSDPSSVPGSQAELTSVALADGAHSFAVRASDAAGNPGQFATLAFAIDISASTPPGGDDPPDGTPPGATAPETVLDLKPKARVVTRGVTKKIRFGFSSPTAGATFECAIQRKKTRKASLAPASFGPCKSPRSYKKKPGIYRFSVRAVAGGLPDETPATVTFAIFRAVGR